MATFNFHAETTEDMDLTINNVKGQIVYHRDLGHVPQGENQIDLDLSGFPNDIYQCQLTGNGSVLGSCKLIIAR